MEVRDVCRGDLERIAELEGKCFSMPWTREQLDAQLGEGHVFLAVCENGEIIGYVGMMYVLDEGYISNVAVVPEQRRRGAAAALLSELEKRARALGLAFLTLEVRQGNAPARALYEKAGYEIEERRKNYYEHPREDAVLMTLYLAKDGEAAGLEMMENADNVG